MATTTLTKPILLDETGQAINQTLDNMQESLDNMQETFGGMEETMLRNLEIAYTDIHSEADGYLSSMAESLATIAENGGGGGGSVTPVSIAITTPPSKTYYIVGEKIDLTDIAVTATYSNSTLKNVTNQCTFSPANNATVTSDMTAITATWTYSDLTFRATYNITVVQETNRVVTPPTKVEYYVGEPLDLTGLVVNAVFSDGSQRVIDNWTCSPAEGTLHAEGDVTLTISGYDSYAHQNYTDTSVTVMYRYEYKPVGIEVTKRPNKWSSYRVGQALDLTGMEVSFNTAEHTSEVVTGWTTNPVDGTILSTLGENTITVSWTDPETSTTYTTTTTVTVSEKQLSSITMTSLPTKRSYYEGELFDSTGLAVIATFDDGTTQDITNVCTVTPADGTTLSRDMTNLSVEWTYNDRTKTDGGNVLFISYPSYIQVTHQPDKITYMYGETLDLTGMIVTAYYPTGLGTEDEAVDVTSECVYSPSNGTTLSTVGVQNINITFYPSNPVNATCPITVVSDKTPTGLTVTSDPTALDTSYNVLWYDEGDICDLTGIKVMASYDYGNNADVTNACVYSPANNMPVLRSSNKKGLQISYTYNGNTVTTSKYTVLCSYMDYISVLSNPNKGQYLLNETLDLTGVSIDGYVAHSNLVDESKSYTIEDVTQDCVFSPAEGTAFTQLGTNTVTVTYQAFGTTLTTSFTVEVIEQPIYSWETGSDEQIAEMLARHYDPNDDFDVTEVWSVGDVRSVSIAAMDGVVTGDGGDYKHTAGVYQFVLSNIGGKTLTTPINGISECAFQVDQITVSVSRDGPMNAVKTNVGGWKDCPRRTWCNTTFKNALPSTLRPIFKQFRCVTNGGYGNDQLETTDDYFALRSSVEYLGEGNIVNGSSGEGSQVEYYETKANRRKCYAAQGSTSDGLMTTNPIWLRSPAMNNLGTVEEGTAFVALYTQYDDGERAWNANGLIEPAVFGVI